ncbi:MAG: hypothetical protein KDD44_06415, partial [Bdellovibrionales bacterium]|nr:hypothetical protein [Bdellovibrionales bacterium]
MRREACHTPAYVVGPHARRTSHVVLVGLEGSGWWCSGSAWWVRRGGCGRSAASVVLLSARGR